MTTTTKMKFRGADVWRVRWQAEGKVKRKFFGTREKEDVLASSVRGEAVGVLRHLATLPHVDQEKLVVVVWKEWARRGRRGGLTSAHRRQRWPIGRAGVPADLAN